MDDFLIKYSQIAAIFDYLSLGAVILSADRRILCVNRSAELLTGLSASDSVGQYCHRVFGEYLCGGTCRYIEASDSEREKLVSQVRITDQISETRSITKIEAPLYAADKRIIGCIEVFQDHTAFKELIRRIRYDDLRLKLILDNLDIGVLTVDRCSHISFFNTAAETVSGFSRSEVLGRSCAAVFGDEFCKGLMLMKKASSGSGTRAAAEGSILTKSGHAVPVQTRYMLLNNEEGAIVGGLVTLSDLSLKYRFDSMSKERYTFYDMVGKDPAMRKIFEIIPVIAATCATVLIEGPTGTGKDLIAGIIHNTSARAETQMVKVNCAAIPDTLLESELFGYMKGAFTGADKDKPGRFHEADGGTIFLDEIGDLPLPLQAKLLRVIEDKEFYPLGSRKTAKVDVRIISATNRDLGQLVRQKLFREDLFYRLNVIRLELPFLKDRKGDIPLLVSHILRRLCAAAGDGHVPGISEESMSLLLNYDYPGNIRELENILEHALVLCQKNTIERKHLPVSLLKNSCEDTGFCEKDRIISMLRKHQGCRGRTAEALDMNRSTLWRKMKKYKIKG